ncbi:MAG: pyrimidine 5'-nucleotidase [Proteobacteria bacterium]|nr:pyrimidine 5'-nucleotidase [Pseudomonadota bacterium]
MQHIEHYIFDLDDTLYPATNGMFAQISERITRRVAETLQLPPDEARAVQKQYWKQYGTSLRGLIVNHDVDAEAFLADVHDVPVEAFLTRDEALRSMLLRLPGRRHVFTNSPREYACRVLAALGVDDLFENVFDIRHSDLRPKPDPHAYARLLDAIGAPASTCLFVDDAPRNLPPARDRGMLTVWLRSPHSMAGGSPGLSVASADDAPAHLTIDTLAQLEGALSRHVTPRP